MRHKFYFGLLLIFFLVNTNLFAQAFWVPDANFRNKLKQFYPGCFTAQDSMITSCTQLQNVTVLDVSNLSIFSLNGIQYFTALGYLSCNHNYLTNLPALPASISNLDCSWNQLTSLPSLPGNMHGLNCSSNKINSLPALPGSLTTLDCSNNLLTSLPFIPNSVFSLECHYNHFTSLPSLPVSLSLLNCSNNQLTNLPIIPENVMYLFCSKNPISCFPDIAPRLPGNQPWLSIIIKNTLISCIPNTGTFPISVVQSSVPLPICNSISKSCSYNITYGNIFLDMNGNGMKESMEIGMALPVYFSGNSGAISDSNGVFYTASDTGNITFQIAIPPYYSATTAASQTIHVVNGVIDTLYFGLQAIPNIKDLQVDLTSIGFLRPGFKAKYKLQYQNVGTDTLYNVQVKFLKPTQLSNLSALPAANSIIGDTLIWNIASLIPFQHGDVIITDSVFANAVLGDTAKAYAWIEPILGDTMSLNNRAISTNIIRGAYDPNDKSVSPEVVAPNSIENLEYIIRFQNTGTDTAFTVTIIDTLSNLLDVYSMEMISASHPYQLSVTNRIAKWIFSNILLPDSNTNEVASHGFIKFNIKPQHGITTNDSITNEAKIYFDYNVPVLTNTIVVKVNLVGVKELKMEEFLIYPNPVQDILRIVNQQKGALGKIELINANGKVLETKTITSSTYTWNLQHLPAGTYILKGQGWGQKVVKE